MARESVDRLKDRIDELESENEALQDQVDSMQERLDSINDISGEKRRKTKRGKTRLSLWQRRRPIGVVCGEKFGDSDDRLACRIHLLLGPKRFQQATDCGLSLICREVS